MVITELNWNNIFFAYNVSVPRQSFIVAIFPIIISLILSRILQK